MYCWNRLNEIAPSGFDKARFLLLSQCDPRYPDDFRPLPNANWTIIGTAVETLKAERNGKKAEADELFRRLKDRGFSGTL